jgi:hypothetical protein
MEESCVAPTEDDFLAAFGVTVDESRPADGYWAYTFEGEMGTTIRLSFNTHEHSVQTTIATPAGTVSTISCEGARRIEIGEEGRRIVAGFAPGRLNVRMVLYVRPRLELTWSGLQAE